MGNDTLDRRFSKKHFPRTNNKDVLEFVFEKDPNMFLRKNKIVIKGYIELNEDYLVENGWVSKLFSQLDVQLDCQSVSTCRNYFYADYIQKIGNFNQPFVNTAFVSEGYYDNDNCDAESITEETLETRRGGYHFSTTSGKKTYRYEFVLIPNLGFLADPLPLLKDCELKLNFDRASSATAIMSSNDVEAPYLEIKDCFATTEWVSSPSLRDYFQGIDYNPIVYKYDEVEVLAKPLPMHTTNLRLDNLRGGNIPSYIFSAIIPTDATNGDLAKSSTNFACHNVAELNITLNGHSVSGYPIEIKNESDTNALFQFNDAIGRTYNNNCCGGLSKINFKTNFLWSHHFEAEETSQGWIGMDIKLSEAFTTSHTMIVWIIYPMSVSIDKYHQVEKMTL